jgi:hypothetical protein
VTDLQRQSPRAPLPHYIALFVALCFIHPALSAATTITYAGFAYAGNADNIATRFKYSKRYEARLKGQGTDINSKLRQAPVGLQVRDQLNPQTTANSPAVAPSTQSQPASLPIAANKAVAVPTQLPTVPKLPADNKTSDDSKKW